MEQPREELVSEEVEQQATSRCEPSKAVGAGARDCVQRSVSVNKRLDLRLLSTDLESALADYDAATLRQILGFVLREYVVEGPPPMRLPPAAELEDLATLSFAELIAALQTRLDHPELALFQVSGDRVLVRAAGALHPLQAPVERAEAAAAQPAPPPATEVPLRGAGSADATTSAREVMASAVASEGVRVTQAAAPSPAASSSPETAGRDALSARGASGAAQDSATSASPAEPSSDDATTRFSLLELD